MLLFFVGSEDIKVSFWEEADLRVKEGSVQHLCLMLSMLEDMVHTTWLIILGYCWVQSPLIFKEGKKKSGQWYFEGLWIWYLGTWFSDQLGSAEYGWIQWS